MKGSTGAKRKVMENYSKETRNKMGAVHVFFDQDKQEFVAVSDSKISTLERAIILRAQPGVKCIRTVLPSKDILVENNRIMVRLPFHIGPLFEKTGKIMSKGRVLKIHLKMIEAKP